MHHLESQLVDFIVEPPADVLSAAAVAPATRAVMDAVAAILAGTTSEIAEVLDRYVDAFAGAGSSPILGTDRLLAPDRAALVNATLGHSMDFDDTVSFMPGHPGTVLVSALLAAIPAEGCSGARFLESFIVGYEVATKLGAGIGMGHYNRGWHSTGTIGIFGAFAAVARLWGLERDVVATGFGITASLASGLRVNFGTMTKPLHSGWAASSGLVAAQLAASGFTGHTTALSSSEGFFSTYGTDESDPELTVRPLGRPLTVVDPGIALKRYPCCYALHRAIDALESIRETEDLSPASVERVEVRVAPGSLKPVPYLRPVTGLEGRFSMPYVVAVGILDGDFGMNAFTDEAVARPAIRELLERVVAREDPACSPGDPEGRSASAGTRGHVVVTVTMTDGRSVERTVTLPPGSPARPLSDEQVAAKFRSCAERTALTSAQTEAALAMLSALIEVEDVRDLPAILAVGALAPGNAGPDAGVIH